MATIKVAHLSPHRDPFEPRTFFEALSGAAAGLDVMVVAPHERDETREGVRILGIPRYRNRLERVTITCWRCVRRAMAERPDIYHLHEPDLIPWGLWLRLSGRRVLYDVHEDYAAAAVVRPWLPGWARRAVAAFVGAVSTLARRAFTIVIAERYYARLFPGGIEVLNYARLEEYAGLQSIARQPPSRPRALYTGSVTDSRGARHHARLLDRLPADAELLLIGQCAIPDLRAELEAKAAADPRLRLVLAPGWVPRSTIAACYAESWTCGLAIFPDTPHYREKELTKFFEYMAAGLPVICSDFPVWRELVVGNAVGLAVDPEDPAAAAAALIWLHEHPEQAAAMGQRGRELVRSRYNWDTQASRLVELYRSMAGDRQ